jgi:hypothetical protein
MTMSDEGILGRDSAAEDEWDFENAERREPTRRPRAVVSVAFSRDDFELVEERAKRLGKKLSEFIREASLARARGSEPIRPVVTFGGMSSGSFFSPDVSVSAGGTKAPCAVTNADMKLEESKLFAIVG